MKKEKIKKTKGKKRIHNSIRQSFFIPTHNHIADGFPVAAGQPSDMQVSVSVVQFGELITRLSDSSSKVLLGKLIVAQLVKNLPSFMQLEISLPCSEEPVTPSYRGPD